MKSDLADENRYHERKSKRPRLERATIADTDDDDHYYDEQRTHKVTKSRVCTPFAHSSNRESIFSFDDGEARTTSNIGLHDLLDSLEEQEKEVTQARGRTPERIDRSPSNRSSPNSSRASSSSSVRTMIDERLEWAHQDRMRSVSRSRPVQQSPFNERSPFYAEYARDRRQPPLRHSTFLCKCCAEDPKEFNTAVELEYAIKQLDYGHLSVFN
jgi:hypothetical protein